MDINYSLTINKSVNNVSVYDLYGNCKGVILRLKESDLEHWYVEERALPEDFGPVLAEHLLYWAKQCGLVVLEPRPHWVTRITGSFNVNDGEQVAERLSRIDKH